MIFNLSISYPWWFILLVLALGLGYATILYLGNSKQKFSPFWRIFLFLMRFVAISGLAFLLLSPFVKSKKRNVEKPIIVIGIDNSKSVVLGKDSLYYKTQFSESIETLKKDLLENYRVDSYLFGAEVISSNQANFSDEISDYSRFFRQVKEDYTGLNIGAVVLAGDGISNRGIDPEFASSGLSVPIYSLALGDTSQSKDLKINDVRYNSLVYLDDDFPIEVNISAEGFEGKNATVEIYAFGQKKGSEKVSITNSRFNKSLKFKLNASLSGRQRITVKVVPEPSEINQENNTRNIFINVLDNRQKILILANAPHPDIAAIKSSLELNQNYEIEVQYADSQKGNLTDFDIVILHQLPSKKRAAQQLINDLKNYKIPVFYILGKQSEFVRFNRQFAGVEFMSPINTFEEAQLVISTGFTLFSFDEEMAKQLEKLPPLVVPFGNYKTMLNANVFGTQLINRMETGLPLIVFYDDSEIRSGAVLGEGLWLWRLHSFLQFSNNKAFDTFIQKSVQYLMARKDKRFFRVLSDGEYGSSKPVILQAELYNSAYELINEPDVNLGLTNESGEQFNFLFSPNQQSYLLDLNRLPVGVYRYRATTKFGGKDYSDNGEFVVSSQSLESRQLNANHGLLYRISEKSGGELLYPNEIEQLPEILGSRDDLKSKIYFEEKYTSLNNLFWVVGLILLLLSLEWFLRKYFGSY